MADEAKVLLEQLDELLLEGATDAEDALEIASVAGMLGRLGHPTTDADVWREGPGQLLLAELWQEIDLAPLVEAIDEVSMGGAEETQVENALFDFDEVVAAAVWDGRADLVASASNRAAASIRQIPDAFSVFSPIGRQMACLPNVGRNLEVYEFWLAVADSGEWVEVG
jgi:hypothetical protein